MTQSYRGRERASQLQEQRIHLLSCFFYVKSEVSSRDSVKFNQINGIQKESVMARKYTKEELKERLQRSIYKVVAEEGIEGVTVRKVSKGCGLSRIFISVTRICSIWWIGDRVQHHRQHRICSSQNVSWIYGQDSSQGTNDLQNSICIIVPASAYWCVEQGNIKAARGCFFVLFRVYFLDVKKYKTTTCW